MAGGGVGSWSVNLHDFGIKILLISFFGGKGRNEPRSESQGLAPMIFEYNIANKFFGVGGFGPRRDGLGSAPLISGIIYRY